MIESDEIEAAQESWGKAVVGVGAASSWEEAHGLAVKLVEDHGNCHLGQWKEMNGWSMNV